MVEIFIFALFLAFVTQKSTLSSNIYGGCLYSNQELESTNRCFKAIQQSDGNFVIYTYSNLYIWASLNQAIGVSNYSLCMQSDGNLVTYSSSKQVIWQSATQNNFGTHNLIMQDDGNLVVYDLKNKVVWNSKTGPYQQGGYCLPPLTSSNTTSSNTTSTNTTTTANNNASSSQNCSKTNAYYSYDYGRCKDCEIPGCLECYGPNTCTQCAQNFVVTVNSSSSSGYYANGGFSYKRLSAEGGYSLEKSFQLYYQGCRPADSLPTIAYSLQNSLWLVSAVVVFL